MVDISELLQEGTQVGNPRVEGNMLHLEMSSIQYIPSLAELRPGVMVLEVEYEPSTCVMIAQPYTFELPQGTEKVVYRELDGCY